MFNLIHTDSGYKADIFLAVRDPLHLWAMRHRQRRPYDADAPEADLLWVAPPECVVIRKLEYFREAGSDKHLRDIRFMLAVTEMDSSFIESQVERLGLASQWWAAQALG